MKITKEQIKKTEQCLVDNGIEADEASTVLQAIGYILLDTELYNDDDGEPKEQIDLCGKHCK